MNKKAIFSSLAVASCLAFAPHVAAAQEAPSDPPPPPVVAPVPPPAPAAPVATPAASNNDDAADLARFTALVRRGHEPTSRYRLAGGLTGLGLGAVTVPVGAVMIGRDSESVGAGIVLGAGIGSIVGGALVLSGLFSDDPYSDAEAAIVREKAQGHDDRSARLAGEAELKRAVDGARTARVVGGAVVLGLGIASLGAGSVFALGDFTGPKLERREQDAIAAGFMAYGVLTTLVGVQSLLFPTTVESTWDGYSAARRSEIASAPRILGIGGGPIPGGGASVGLTAAF